MREHAAVVAVARRGAATIAAAFHRRCPLSPSRCYSTVHRHPSQSPLRHRRRHPPPPAFADPFVGWLLRCFMLSCDRRRSQCRPLLPPIVVHPCHRRHRRSCRCRRAAATATATTLVELTVVGLQRKRQQQQHHQHTSCRTIV